MGAAVSAPAAPAPAAPAPTGPDPAPADSEFTINSNHIHQDTKSINRSV